MLDKLGISFIIYVILIHSYPLVELVGANIKEPPATFNFSISTKSKAEGRTDYYFLTRLIYITISVKWEVFTNGN